MQICFRLMCVILYTTFRWFRGSKMFITCTHVLHSDRLNSCAKLLRSKYLFGTPWTVMLICCLRCCCSEVVGLSIGAGRVQGSRISNPPLYVKKYSNRLT